MKYFALLLCSIFFLNGCSNEFEIAEDFKDIPIVYALVNPIDTANYIRLERAFTSEDISALDLAQIPDSLYYKNATITISNCLNEDCTEIDNSTNFEQVDGNLEGYPRKDGVFATAPNTIYKLLQSDFTIVPGTQYHLSIDRGNGLPLVTATTTAIVNPRIVAPSSLGSIIFKSGATTKFEWKYLDSDLSPGEISDVILKFKYQESVDNGPFENKTLRWDYANNVRTGEVEKDGADFYNFLVNNLETDSNTKRVFDKVDFELYSAGPELLSFINIGLANLGITSTQDVPTFTNMSEGLGFFTSLNLIELNNINLNQETLDTLKTGSITKDLNFQ